MAESLQKLQASRAGYRADLTQTLKKSTKIMAKETPSEIDLVSLKNIVEQLARKKTHFNRARRKNRCCDRGTRANLNKEIFDTEVIQEDIDETSSQISRFIHYAVSVKKPPPNTPPQ
ncbi:hypothetical protein OS493_030250 [Desmophyllum pertusum]|uniref:Uncharacterized protein n=1 Tax=Desmophyllum pertusum TaxID=174260 RepID=A0A9W9YC13_9CNID|nr:hypothetical protein OS493_030250 [Desmophyllum pertusum]